MLVKLIQISLAIDLQTFFVGRKAYKHSGGQTTPWKVQKKNVSYIFVL